MTLIHSLVIATLNRPHDVSEALRSVVDSRLVPQQIVIVDASESDDTSDVVEDFSSAYPAVTEWVYVRAERGLTKQRNLGVKHARGDIVHFLDDDVVVDDAYFAELDKLLEESKFDDVVGVGGLVSAQGSRRPRIWWRFGLLDSRKQGVVLSSGCNVVTDDLATRTEVQWLSGCAMSYRRRVFDSEEFDESLAGYALMEDVDFSYRAATYGRLVVVPEARLVHKVSQVERWSFNRRYRASVYRRYWFVRKNMSAWNVLPYAWSVAFAIVFETFLGVITLRMFRVRVAGWRVLGVYDLLRGMR